MNTSLSKDGEESDKNELQFPPVFSVCNGRPGGKICPFIPAQIMLMPMKTKNPTIITAETSQSQAYVRQLSPCVEGACMAWIEPKQFHNDEGEPMSKDPGFCSLIPRAEVWTKMPGSK